MSELLKEGITLIHEHITIDLSGVKQNDDCNLNCYEETLEEFKELYRLGVRNVIDVTADGMGRNVEYVEKVSHLSGINIIQATGYYKEPFLPDSVYTMTVAELAQKMVKEINHGIGDSIVKAGVIGEIGTSKNSFEPLEQKVFEAACLAAKETGAVISTHTTLSTMALEQAAFFLERGMDPASIIIGHQDLLGDEQQINILIDQGFYVAFDTIGKNNYFPDETRAEIIYRLQEAGKIDHICLSLDITRKSNMKHLGGIGYSYMFTDFIPLMKSKGVTEASIHAMLVENPQRLFGGKQMKVYPLKSITISEATAMQFRLVDAITHEFKGSEFLGLGDLGVQPLRNMPQTTNKVERVLARFFAQEDSVFVRGAGTGAIREALASIVKAGDTVMVHTAPVYSTTITTLDHLGLKIVACDFNSLADVQETLQHNTDIKAVLIQYTRQALTDSYDMETLIHTIKSVRNIPIITDDNYAVMKVAKIGVELGADLSCFSCFKLLGPEGIGLVVGKKQYVDAIHGFHYSGGSQTQGHEALEALRGFVFAPVTHALQAVEAEKIVDALNDHAITGIDKAVIVNAQSKVILVRLLDGKAKDVLHYAEQLGAAPYPVGAESKYELVPMFYKVSGTMKKENKEFATHWLRINPMRSGADTVLRILEEAMKKVKECS